MQNQPELSADWGLPVETNGGELRQRVMRLGKEKQELQALGQMASHSFSNALHDLRTPLVAVRGYAKLILEERAGPINSGQREFLEIILKNANRLAGLLSDLTRAASTRQLHLGWFDIRSLWQQAAESLRLPAEKKSIAVVEESSPGPFLVAGDREKLLIVLYKLLSHTIELAGHGSEIRVEFSRDEDRINLRVSDVGAAALPEDDPGLRVVHDIVWQHGGRMSMASSPGQGYTFTLMLPVIQNTYEQTPDSGC